MVKHLQQDARQLLQLQKNRKHKRKIYRNSYFHEDSFGHCIYCVSADTPMMDFKHRGMYPYRFGASCSLNTGGAVLTARA